MPRPAALQRHTSAISRRCIPGAGSKLVEGSEAQHITAAAAYILGAAASASAARALSVTLPALPPAPLDGAMPSPLEIHIRESAEIAAARENAAALPPGGATDSAQLLCTHATWMRGREYPSADAESAERRLLMLQACPLLLHTLLLLALLLLLQPTFY